MYERYAPDVVATINDSKQLDRDIKVLLEDLDTELAVPGSVRFAVDFSEIFAYLLQSSLASELKIFHDDEDGIVRAREAFVLDKLLMHGGFGDDTSAPGVLLLMPHQEELHSFLSRRDLEYFDNFIDRVPDAWEEMKRLFEATKTEEIKVEANGVFVDGRPLTEQGVQKVLQYLARVAPRIVDIAKQASDQARTRLRRLLEGGRLTTLAALARDWDLGDVKPDQDEHDRWRQQLGLRRRGGRSKSNEADARAVSLVHAVNRRVVDQRRLLLVTRSPAMHRIAEEFAATSMTRPPIPLLRHPRYLSALTVVGGRSGRDRHDDLTRLSADVTSFLSLCKRGPDGQPRPGRALDAAGTEPWRSRYDRSLNSIKARLNDISGLSSLVTSVDDRRVVVKSDGHRVVSANDRATFEAFRQLVAVVQRYQGRVLDRVAQLGDEIGRLYQFLGIPLIAQVVDDNLAHSSLKVQVSDTSVVITSEKQLFPYQIHLYSNDLLEWARSRQPDELLGREHVMDLIQRSIDTVDAGHSEYENLLTIACILGAWGKWSEAARYCDLALTRNNYPNATFGDHPPHEALLFSSVCIRRQKPTMSSQFMKAILNVRAARNLWQTYETVESEHGARFLFEEGVTQFLWDYRLSASSPSSLPFVDDDTPEKPDVAEAVLLCEQALKISTDHDLRSHLHNTLCYHFLIRENREEALEHLKGLRACERALKVKPEEWPPAYIDTEVYAELLLHHQNQDSDMTKLEALVPRLKSAIDRIEEEHKGDLKEHLDQICAEIARRKSEQAASGGVQPRR